MSSALTISFVGIYPLYDGGVIGRFEVDIPADCSGPAEFSGTTAAIVRRPVDEVMLVGESWHEDGSRTLRVSMRNRTYRWGLRLTVIVRRGDSTQAKRSLRVSFEDCRKAEQLWLEKRRNVQNDNRYDAWLRAHQTGEAELARQREEVQKLAIHPLISIVTPVFCPPPTYLREMIDSVLAQSYPHFELVLVNASGENAEIDEVLASYHDERIRIITTDNRSIAENTNVGIEAAQGDYLAFVDHDDWIEPDTLYRYVQTIAAQPEADLLFCDEDMWGIPDGADTSTPERFFGPKFKPGWNPSRLLDGNIVCHMLMVSRVALERIELSPPELTGAQDYDLTLKAWEVARAIVHVPHMLYHWRSYPDSSATNLETKPYLLAAGQSAVQAHFDRVGIEARVEPGSYPLTYRTRFAPVQPGLRVVTLSLDSVSDNDAVCDADIVVLAREGVVLEDQCVNELVGVLSRSEVGIAAPITLDTDGIVASAGLTMCADGTRTPMSAGLAPVDTGYSQFLCCNHDVSALAPSLLAMRANLYRSIGGIDPVLMDMPGAAVVDLCMRVGERGLFCCVVATAHVRILASENENVEGAEELIARYPYIAEGDSLFPSNLDPASPFYQLS